MRFYLITIFFLIFGLNFVQAQRFGYIDTDFILNKMPEYKKAQDEINRLSELWEKEVQEMLQYFRQEDLPTGIIRCIEHVGRALQEKFPYEASTDRNELPDEIIFG